MQLSCMVNFMFILVFYLVAAKLHLLLVIWLVFDYPFPCFPVNSPEKQLLLPQLFVCY